MSVASYPCLSQLDVAGKVVLVRADLDVPFTPRGDVANDLRLQGLIPTLKSLKANGARIVICGHAGRPHGRYVSSLSLAPVAARLKELMGQNIYFVPDSVGRSVDAAVNTMGPGDIIMLENTRFHSDEELNSDELAGQFAKYAHIYVNDSFCTAHRKHTSTYATAQAIGTCALGHQFIEELHGLAKILHEPERPLTLICGGAKISSKIEMIKNLLPQTDQLILGGALANTFLATLGYRTGTSLVEQSMLNTARDILREAGVSGCRVLVPSDVVIAEKLVVDSAHKIVPVSDIPDDMMALDVGTETIQTWKNIILPRARTILWNGPMGANEYPPFDHGTNELARAVAESDAFTLVGGGDTLNAVQHAGVDIAKFDAASTAGGALLAYLSGQELPALEAVLKSQT